MSPHTSLAALNEIYIKWHLTDCSAVFWFVFGFLAWEIWRKGADWISSGKGKW